MGTIAGGSAAVRRRIDVVRSRLGTFSLVASAVVGCFLAMPPASAMAQPPSPTPSTTRPYLACPPPARGHASCLSVVVPQTARLAGVQSQLQPFYGVDGTGYGPADLRSAYDLTSASSAGGSGATVAIVDAFDDPNIEADLGTYRSAYGLPPCTTANGCFRKVNQTGGTSYPTPDQGWAVEMSLDVDMVSAICPNCKILVVEANSSQESDLSASVNEAATLGATAISNSWAAPESQSTDVPLDADFKHPGIPITAASGDWGYLDWTLLAFMNLPAWPASSPNVVSVGGTTLTASASSRGWSETAWKYAGSGCSTFEPKPTWQTDTGCLLPNGQPGRTYADVSAVADPATGVSVYDSYIQCGCVNEPYSYWWLVGGTSAATPIVASIEALSSSAARALGADALYANVTSGRAPQLNDVTSGSNASLNQGPGNCNGTYLCTAGPGYDGPTGLGTPNGPFPAPSGPAISSVSPSSGSQGGGTTVTITGVGFTGATGVTFGTHAGTNVHVTPTSITATSPSGSAGTVDIQITSPSGTSTLWSADQFTYLGSPTVTALSPLVGPTAGGTLVRVTGTNLTGASQVTFGGVPGTNVVVSSPTTLEVTNPAGSAGTADVRVTTPLGTSPTSSADQFTYVLPPTITGVSPNTHLSIYGGTVVTITGTNLAYAENPVATLVTGGGGAAAIISDSNTSITAYTPASAGNAEYTADLQVTTAGGVTAKTTADQVTYANPVPPTVTSLSPSSGASGGGYTVDILGSGLANARSVTFGSASATIQADSDGDLTVIAPPGTNGATVPVTVTTSAGSNTAGSSSQFTYTAPASLAVTGVTPSAGPVGGGTSVTITGAGFTGATRVLFGSSAATTFHVSSDTSITATSPAGSDSTGWVDVRVVGPSGESPVSGADQFAYGPTVSGYAPNYGPVTGGTAITISGTGFQSDGGVSAVTIAGAGNLTNLHVVSDTQMTGVVPAQSSGTSTSEAVTVTTAGTAGQVASKLFAATPQWYYGPAITSVSPSGGPLAGGTNVTINGLGFTGTDAVYFGSTPATSYKVNSNSSITATSPAGTAGTVDITVYAVTAPSNPAASDHYTYQAAPTVSGVSPGNGPVAGGTSVTISGGNYANVSQVYFGSKAATSFTVNSSSQITATAPAGTDSTGWVDVRVVTPGGESAVSSADQFVYGPAVTSSSPTSGPVGGGTTVTITGTGFQSDGGVTVVLVGGGGSLSNLKVVSDTQITGVTPAKSPISASLVLETAGTSGQANSLFISAGGFNFLPTVSSVSPAQGALAGGSSVTITGTGFTGASQVWFGSTAATSFRVNSSTSITATAPAGSDSTGWVDVRVVSNNEESATTTADQFVYGPTITSLSPTSGPVDGGTQITLTGTGFKSDGGVASVLVNNLAATSVTVSSDTSLTAVVPAATNGLSGTAAVVVKMKGTTGQASTASATAPQVFAYVPRVGSLTGTQTPVVGAVAGGTSVSVIGNGFAGATKVLFGSTAATSFTVNSNTSITAVSPPGSDSTGWVDIRVITPAGESAVNGNDQFVYGPTIASISPTSGPIAGGTVLTVTGTGFNSDGGVAHAYVGPSIAPSIKVNSDTSMTVTTPPSSTGQAGAATVVLATAATPGQTAQPAYVNGPVYNYK